jgi:Helix-turn-helix of DDE superfamily endonuclease
MVEQYFVVLPKMKNPLHYIHKYPNRSKQILGIGFEEWFSLLEQVKREERRREREREEKKVRINKIGGGRPKILNLEEELCLCIFYLRHLPTFEVLGIQFGVSKTTANDIFNNWLSILRKILPCSLMEELERKEEEEAAIAQILIEYELIVDSWEQGRERPIDYQRILFRQEKTTHI